MGVLGIFDFMVVNGRMVWYASANGGHHDCLQLAKQKFRIILAEKLLAFRDESACDHVTEANMQ